MNKEMVQALGININRVFLLVFMVGAAMAAFGGVLFGSIFWCDLCGNGDGICHFSVYSCCNRRDGDFTGSLFAAIFSRLSGAFMAYYVPDLSLAVNMILMAIVLIFRPQGLFGKGVKNIELKNLIKNTILSF